MTQLAPTLETYKRVAEKGLFFRSISVIGILSDLSIRTRTKTLEAPTSDSSTLNRATSELLGALVGELGDLETGRDRSGGLRGIQGAEFARQSS